MLRSRCGCQPARKDVVAVFLFTEVFALRSALQRALETTAPSATVVLGELLAHLAALGSGGASVSIEVDRHGEIQIESSTSLFDPDSLVDYCATKGCTAFCDASQAFTTLQGVKLPRPATGAGFDTLFRLSDAPLVLCGELCFRLRF